MREKEKIESLPEEIIEIHKQIDVVINNAGLSIIGKVDEVDEEDWEFGVDILLNAVIQMSTAFLPHLQKRPEAAIVNVSSIFGLFSVPKQSIYNVGKFGVKEAQDKFNQLYQDHTNDRGIWIKNPKQTIKDADKKVY